MTAGRPRRGGAAGFLRSLARVLLVLATLPLTAWGGLALAIDGPGKLAGGVFVLGCVALLALVRPLRRGWIASVVLFAGVLGWWLTLAPSNDRSWLPQVSRLPTMEVRGDRLIVRDLRNFDYRSRSDFTPRWEERGYDLAEVVGVDLAVCDWGASLIVHTFLSWEFEGGRHLAVSIETRKEQGEGYSALRGFFRQFELYYAVADERDLIGVRTVVRGERVRLYRLGAPREQARQLLETYAAQTRRLAEEPAWYNALDHNCTTSIRLHAVHLGIERPWDWRILVNGRGEELLYARGMIDTSLPFEQLRDRSDVTEAARAAYDLPGFSQRIRADLPPRPRAR